MISLHDMYQYCGPLAPTDIPDLTPVDRLYRLVCEARPITKSTVEQYNHLINHGISRILAGNCLNKPPVEVLKVVVDFPLTRESSHHHNYHRITPHQACLLGLDYESDIRVFFRHQGEIFSEKIGSIPIPVGCCRCITAYPPQEFPDQVTWAATLGEDPYRGHSYFIHNGSKKAVVMAEKIRYHIFSSGFEDKDNKKVAVTRNKNLFNGETSSFMIMGHTQHPTILCNSKRAGIDSSKIVKEAGDNGYPLFMVFFCLWYADNTEMQIEIFFDLIPRLQIMIADLAPFKYRQDVLAGLQPSVDFFLRSFTNQNTLDINAILTQYRRIHSIGDGQVISLSETAAGISREIFRHQPIVKLKMANLSVMVCQHILAFQEKRPFEVLDDWSNKQLETIAKTAENNIWSFVMEYYSKMTTREDIRKGVNMENKLSSSFKMNGVVSKQSTEKSKINIQAYQNETLLAASAQRGRCQSGVSSRTNKKGVRAVQATQFGVIDTFQTPESGQAGIIKHPTALAKLSISRIDQGYDQIILGMIDYHDQTYSYDQWTERCPFTLVINEQNTICISSQMVAYIQEETDLKAKVLKDRVIITTDTTRDVFRVPHWRGEIFEIPAEQNELLEICEIFGMINPLFSIAKNYHHAYYFLINGSVVVREDNFVFPVPIWVSSDFSNHLRQARIKGVIPIDCCIFLNTTDMRLEYYDDGGRIMVPYLRIHNGVLDIDADPSAWSEIEAAELTQAEAVVDSLMAKGYIEMIDVKEQDQVLIARGVDEARNMIFLKNTVLALEAHRPPGQGRYHLQAMTNFFYDVRNYPADLQALRLENRGYQEMLDQYLRPRARELKLDLSDHDLILSLVTYLNTKLNFTHCMIHPLGIFSEVSSNVTLANHSQAPRLVFHSAMMKQGMTLPAGGSHKLFESNRKFKFNAKPALLRSIGETTSGICNNPTKNGLVTMYATDPDSFEDALVCSDKTARDTHYYKIFTATNNPKLKMGKPATYSNGGRVYQQDFARHLMENGLPRLGSQINKRDIIIGHVSEDRKTRVNSVTAEFGSNGMVVRVFCWTGNNNDHRASVLIRERRCIIQGDKVATTPAQKGTLVIRPRWCMPRVVGGPNDGMVIQTIFNIMGIPSRMTPNTPMEIMLNKLATRECRAHNGTTFYPQNMEAVQESLSRYGLDPGGFETVSHSTGQIIQSLLHQGPQKMFVGHQDYMFLHHTILDKNQGRETGDYDINTGQPVRGRGTEGGTRFGEMETGALMASGAPTLLHDFTAVSSDGQWQVFCRNCRTPAISYHLDRTRAICKICGHRTTDPNDPVLVRVFASKASLNMFHALYASMLKLQTKLEPVRKEE